MPPPADENHLTVDRRVAIPLDELEFRFSRSSGPGGQNVNKVNSKVTLRWSPATSRGLPPDVAERFLQQFAYRLTNAGELLVSSQRFVDQARNRADCLEKLRGLIQQVVQPPKTRKATRPTQGSHRRRLETKRRTSTRKQLRRTPRSHDD